MVYLQITIKRTNKNNFAFIDKLQEKSATVIERNVLELNENNYSKIKLFINNYSKYYDYLKLF